MEYLKSTLGFLWGTLKWGSPALALVFLDLVDVWERYIRPHAPEAWRDVTVPPHLFWPIVGLIFLWAATVTYHQIRMDKLRWEEAGERDLEPLDYDRVDEEDRWPVYEVAYMWYGYEPPATGKFIDIRDTDIERREIEVTFDDLWEAIRDEGGDLERCGSGTRVGKWYAELCREDLIDYCEKKGEKPPFLFPEERRFVSKVKHLLPVIG